MFSMIQLIAEVVYAGVMITVGMISTESYLLPAKEQVIPVVFNEVRPIWVNPCKYSGVLVPFERDWEERNTDHDGHETIIPADPGPIAGYGILLNKKGCPGEATEHVSMYITKHGENTIIPEKTKYVASDLSSLKEEMKPKWLPQVNRILEAQAESNPVVASFFEFSKQNTKAVETAKDSKSEAEAKVDNGPEQGTGTPGHS